MDSLLILCIRYEDTGFCVHPNIDLSLYRTFVFSGSATTCLQNRIIINYKKTMSHPLKFGGEFCLVPLLEWRYLFTKKWSGISG